MLVQKCWLLSLLFIVSTTAILSTSSTLHTSISTTNKTTVPTNYLIASETAATGVNDSYFKIIPDFDPINPLSGDKVLQFGDKNSSGAANFTLNADGTLQCNSESGPLYASVPYVYPDTYPVEFEDQDHLDEYGLVALTCAIVNAILTCRWGPIEVFYYLHGSLNIGRVESGAFIVVSVVPA